MTTYNAKDLIQQASMLADLQNSDFISWKENMMFLDNAWTELYQQIINHGDKTFLKSLTFSGTSLELPDDFYQLYYVCYGRGEFKTPINRRAKTTDVTGAYYDIIGNQLLIYNMTGIEEVYVEYYPVRKSITYASDDVRCDSVPGTIIDTTNKQVLYKDSSNAYHIKDVVNNGEAVDADAGFMLISGESISSTNPTYKADNRCYFSIYDEDNKKLCIYKGSDSNKLHPIVTLTDIENPDFPTNQINALVKDGIYYVKDEILYFYDFSMKKAIEMIDNVTDNRVYAFNDSIYYQTVDGLWCDDILIMKAMDYDTFNGVMKVDENTGYGIFVDNYLIKSAYPNTEFYYPNNFYYTYMAYKLAVYYKIKQGADANNLSALAENALKTFYDTLPRDENEFVRISNVYAR